jgi:hypothetical protein
VSPYHVHGEVEVGKEARQVLLRVTDQDGVDRPAKKFSVKLVVPINNFFLNVAF